MSPAESSPFVADKAIARMPRRKLTAQQAAKFNALRTSIEAELAESGKDKGRRARARATKAFRRF